MTPEEKKLYALMAVAEQQQDAVKQATQALNETQDRIQNIMVNWLQHVLSCICSEYATTFALRDLFTRFRCD